MKPFLLTLVLSLTSTVVFAQQNLAELAENGKTKVESCIACHGQDGNSPSASFPKLAGQNMRYLVKQLAEIQSGERSAPLMAGLLDNFNNDDLEAIAAYYSIQTPTIGTAKKDLVELGEKIYRAGNMKKGLPACTGCHSPTGYGNPPAGFPQLSGQHSDYTAAQLKAFRSKQRTNGPMMMEIAEKMNDEEIAAVSSYIEGLHAQPIGE